MTRVAPKRDAMMAGSSSAAAANKAPVPRGPTVAADFQKIVIDYIERRFGTGATRQTAAE